MIIKKTVVKPHFRHPVIPFFLFGIICLFSTCLCQAQSCNIITTVAGNGYGAGGATGIGFGGYTGDGGPATAAEINYPEGIAVDVNGNLFISDAQNYCIRKVSTSGIITTYAGTGVFGYSGDGGPATAARINNPAGLAIDLSGNLYIADQNNNNIRKVTPSGIISTICGGVISGGFSGDGGPATAAALSGPNDVAVDNTGNIYIADRGNNRVRKIFTSGIITTIGGNGAAGFSGDGGQATAAGFQGPEGITVNNNGEVYLAANSRIRKISSTGIITTVAGNGSYGSGGDGGQATAANISFPFDVAIDVSGNMYIADGVNYNIRKVTPAGIISTITGNGFSGYAGDGGVATAAILSTPVGLATDITGNIYITDRGNNRIRKITIGSPPLSAIIGASTVIIGSSVTLIDTTSGGTWSSSSTGVATINSAGVVTGVSAGTSIISYSVTNSCGTTIVTHPLVVTTLASCNIITTIAGNGTAGYSGDGTSATSSKLNNPKGVAVDRNGNIYISDQVNNRIRRVSTSGIITTVAGNGTAGFSGDGGMASAAQLNSPYGLAIDQFGDLFIADWENGRIRMVTPSGIIKTIAGNGGIGYTGDSVAATTTSLSGAYGVAVDSIGNVYIADGDNFRIRKVTPDGIIRTIAGNGTGGFSGDGGPAIDAEIDQPSNICIDGGGNIYFADWFNNRIRKINPAGMITTIAGTGVAGYSGDGAAATAAELNQPVGIVTDHTNNLFISESAGNRIRKINASGTIFTYAGTGIAGFSGDGGFANAAEINAPDGLAIDSAGDIYLADDLNSRIRKITSGNPVIGNIQGAASVCTGATVTLTDTTSGGVWTVANPSIATVGSSGVVHGLSAGVDTIFYSVSNACGTTNAKHVITVHTAALGGTITGVASLCVGASVPFNDTTSGGVWSSSTPGVATVSSSGVVTGVSAGSADIEYFVSGSCGSAGTSYGVIINPLANAGIITGASSSCAGGVATPLTDTVAGGVWSSFSSAIATVSSSGIVSGLIPGVDTIRYSVTNTCGTTTVNHVFTVNTNPVAGTLTGAPVVCIGNATTLVPVGGAVGGVWGCSNTAATVSGGIATGISAGVDTVRYSVLNACGADTSLFAITIVPSPDAGIIGGPSAVCVSTAITLSDTVSGGVWNFTNPHATVTGGLVNGISAGVDTLLYTVTGAYCANTARKIVSVIVVPYVSAISGPSIICVGTSVSLSDSVAGGTWGHIAGNVSVAPGTATGLTAGPDTVTYSVSNICGTSTAMAPVNVEAYTFPTLGIINTHDTPCAVLPVTLLANITNGGSDPLITWYKNGVYVDTGLSYTYPPVFGDVITCHLLSNASCLSVTYANDTFVIDSHTPVTPFATIHTPHDTISYLGEIIAFDAEETYGGSDPHYQWYLNGHLVPGATTNAYSVTVYTNDTVFCKVTSNLPCITQVQDTSNTIVIHAEYLEVNSLQIQNGLSVFPNPNIGSFTIHLSAPVTEDAVVTISNLLGEKVQEHTITTNRDNELKLNVPAGIYVLSVYIRDGTMNKKLVVE